MSGWPRVKLGEVLRRSNEAVEPSPDVEYKEVTVRLWGCGVLERGKIHGIELKGRRFVARQGQFIASRIDARNGAMGIVPAALDGAVVTNDFPLFDINHACVDSAYLGWLSRTASFVDMCNKASEGTTNRVRLKQEAFLSVEIPLPPLAEQQRLIAQIEALQSEVEHVMGLQHDVDREVDALCRAVLASDPNAPPMRLRDLVSLRRPDVSVRADETYHFAGVYSFGRGVFVGERKSGLDFSYPKLTRLRAGDFVYPKLMAWEGAFGIVPRECDGLVVSTEFPVFELNRDRVLPDVVDTYFRDPALWPQIAGSSIGTNVRRRRLNPQDFLDHEMPVPTMAVQDRLRRVRAQVDLLKADRAASRTELDALMPAVLDRAFAGLL